VTAEVLARGKWSASVYRTGFNYAAGFSNVAEFPADIWRRHRAAPRSVHGVQKRSAASIAIFVRCSPPTPKSAGRSLAIPTSGKYWTGSKIGDLLVGLKASLLSESYGQPVAVAVRGHRQLPTGDRDAGVSTGKTDGYLDLVVSKDVARLAEISGYAGGVFRGNPGDVSQSNGLALGDRRRISLALIPSALPPN